MRVTGSIGRMAYSETATLDRYRNPVPGYLAAVDFPVYSVQPRQSVEERDGTRVAVITGATVFAPFLKPDGTPNPKPGTRDRFLVNGETWEVHGKVGVWDGKESPVGGFLVLGGYQFDIEERRG